MPSPISKLLPNSQRVRLVLTAGLLALAIVATSFVIYQRSRITPQRINYSQLYQIVEGASAASLTIDGETLTVSTTNGALFQATVTSGAAQEGIVDLLRKRNVPIEFRALQPGPLATALSWLLPLT